MIAPEPHLIALHRVLYVATTTAKNLAFGGPENSEQIAVLLDAVNHIPELLCDWKRFDDKILLNHLGTYDETWGQASNLRLIDVYRTCLAAASRGENWALWPRP